MISDLEENKWVNNLFIEIVKFVDVDNVMTRRGQRVIYIFRVRDSSGECFLKLWNIECSSFIEEYIKPGKKAYVVAGYVSIYNSAFFINVNKIQDIKIVV